jgi:hypothetical protein
VNRRGPQRRAHGPAGSLTRLELLTDDPNFDGKVRAFLGSDVTDHEIAALRNGTADGVVRTRMTKWKTLPTQGFKS